MERAPELRYTILTNGQTLDISSEFIFGRSMDALTSPDACKDFMDAFMAAQRDVVIPIAQRPEEYKTWCKTVLDYIDDRIDEASKRAASLDDDANKQLRIVDELWKTTKDRYSLRYLILSIFSPAHDTVAITVANAMFHLARNSRCWAKLRAEILPTTSSPLTYELLNSYKYLTWILRESKWTSPNHHLNCALTLVYSSSHNSSQCRNSSRVSLNNSTSSGRRQRWSEPAPCREGRSDRDQFPIAASRQIILGRRRGHISSREMGDHPADLGVYSFFRWAEDLPCFEAGVYRV
jgi:hypothetical protein